MFFIIGMLDILLIGYICLYNFSFKKHKKYIIAKYKREVLKRCERERRPLSLYGYELKELNEICEISNLRFRFAMEDKGFIPKENIDIRLIEVYKQWFPEYTPLSVFNAILTFSSVLFASFLGSVCYNLISDKETSRYSINFNDGLSTIVMNIELFKGLVVVFIGLSLIMIIYIVLKIINKYSQRKVRKSLIIRERLNNIIIELLSRRK